MHDSWWRMFYDWLSLLFGLPIWPGVIGSVGALLWVEGTWPRKCALVGLGSVTSFYGGAWVVSLTGLDPKFAGFIVGLFGMSIVDNIFKTWTELGLSSIIREFVRAVLAYLLRRVNMDWLMVYIVGAYGFILIAAAFGAFNRAFCANLVQRIALMLFAVWAAWRIQLILSYGYAWPHEFLSASTMCLYAAGTIAKTIAYRRSK